MPENTERTRRQLELPYSDLLSSQGSAIPLDRFAALLIVAAVLRTGWQLLSDAMRVLLDASVEPAQLAAARLAIERDPHVAELKWISGRNAGRYRFLEAGVVLRERALAKSATVVQRIEAEIVAAVPHLERVLIHVEPGAHGVVRIAVPMATPAGSVSEHFGSSPWFGLFAIDPTTRRVTERTVVSNPFQLEEKRKGLRVAGWLITYKIDVLLSRESLRGSAPAFAFADASVEVRGTAADDVDAAIDEFARSLGHHAGASAPMQDGRC